MKGLIGKKLGMTTVYRNGVAVPVTVVRTGPCVVVQKKTVESDGYNAIQIGFEKIEQKHANKPMMGHFKKAGVEPVRYLKEIRTDDVEKYEIGQLLDVSIFEEGEAVDAIARTHGKGFQGPVKRWGFGGHVRSHGTKYPRHGSTGMHSEPAKVLKGTKMPGHMGNANKAILNLEVVKIDKDNSLLAIKGAVPGSRGTLVYIRTAVRNER